MAVKTPQKCDLLCSRQIKRKFSWLQFTGGFRVQKGLPAAGKILDPYLNMKCSALRLKLKGKILEKSTLTSPLLLLKAFHHLTGLTGVVSQSQCKG